jgi:hypothetical protein
MTVHPSDMGVTWTLLSSRATTLLSSWNDAQRQILEITHSMRQVTRTFLVECTSSAAALDPHVASSYKG